MAHAISTYCSGAHGLLVGSINMAVGVTMDMSGMNKMTLSADKTIGWVHSLELNNFQVYVPGVTPSQVAVLRMLV